MAIWTEERSRAGPRADRTARTDGSWGANSSTCPDGAASSGTARGRQPK